MKQHNLGESCIFCNDWASVKALISTDPHRMPFPGEPKGYRFVPQCSDCNWFLRQLAWQGERRKYEKE